MVVLLLVARSAAAHPFGDRYTAQRLDVVVDHAGVTVALTADLPDPLLRALGRSPNQALDDLPLGLVVAVDGHTLPLSVARRQERTDLLEPGTHILEVVVRAAAPLDGPHRVEVSNGNLSGLPGWYLDDVRLAPTMRLDRSTLLVPLRDGTIEDLGGAWSQSELRRRVRLEVDGTEHAGTRWWRRVMPTPVPAAEALPVSAWTAWRTGRTSPAVTALAHLWCGLAGFTGLGAMAYRRIAWTALAASAVVVGLGPPTPRVPILLGALVALGLAARGGGRAGLLAAVLLASVGAGLDAAPWRASLTGAWLLGGVLGGLAAGRHPRVAGAAAAALGVLALTRGPP